MAYLSPYLGAGPAGRKQRHVPLDVLAKYYNLGQFIQPLYPGADVSPGGEIFYGRRPYTETTQLPPTTVIPTTTRRTTPKVTITPVTGGDSFGRGDTIPIESPQEAFPEGPPPPDTRMAEAACRMGGGRWVPVPGGGYCDYGDTIPIESPQEAFPESGGVETLVPVEQVNPVTGQTETVYLPSAGGTSRPAPGSPFAGVAKAGFQLDSVGKWVGLIGGLLAIGATLLGKGRR